MSCLAIIPARGGSKRIPKKNIISFLGSPMIKYSIDAALKSKCFEEIMVSTDDKEIASVASRLGAKVPFMRSNDNSKDCSILADAVLEVIEQYEQLGRKFEYICVILPTAPLIKVKTLKEGFALIKKGAQAVIPVVAFSYPIQRAFKVKNTKLKMFDEAFMHVNSQALEPAYHDAGQFYYLKTSSFKKQKKIFLDKSQAIILRESEVQDIDVLEDLKIAELKYKLQS